MLQTLSMPIFFLSFSYLAFPLADYRSLRLFILRVPMTKGFVTQWLVPISPFLKQEAQSDGLPTDEAIPSLNNIIF